jgi:hypothetical protein
MEQLESITKVHASTLISPEIHRTVLTDQRQSDQDTGPGVCVSTSMTRQSRVTIIPWHKNPGKLSLQGRFPPRQFPARRSLEVTLGTNTYVIGTSNPYILVDTGQGKLYYPPFSRTVLGSPQHPSLPDISDIILTHRHIDHVCGVPSVLISAGCVVRLVLMRTQNDEQTVKEC